MPEGDQIKWRGIRPTDPPEDLPVTMGGEVVHVIVDSGGGGNPSPGKIMNFFDQVVACGQDVWNTVLEVDPGAGFLLWFGMNPGNGDLADWRLRFTIDGVLGDTINMDDMQWGFTPDPVAHDTTNIKLDFGTVRFNASFLVELMTVVDNKAYRVNIGYTIDNP